MNSIQVWHFAAKTLRDGSPHPEPGTTLPHIDNPKACNRGYHGSEDILDALQYAHGPYICKRELFGTVIAHDNDKHCASDALQLTPYVDVTDVLVRFARYCALTALRVDAANALRKAGFIEHANSLSTLHDDCDMNAAEAAARAARNAAEAAWAARAARAAARAAWAAAWATARNAAWAAWAARDARDAAEAAWAAVDTRKSEQRAWLLNELSK